MNEVVMLKGRNNSIVYDKKNSLLINMIMYDEPFEKIITSFTDNGDTVPEFMHYFDTVGIEACGEELVQHYFENYYVYKYNGDSRWNNSSFSLLWSAVNNSIGKAIQTKSCIRFIDIAQKAYKSIINDYLYLPKDYLRCLSLRMQQLKPISFEQYGFANAVNFSYCKFIIRYFTDARYKDNTERYLRGMCLKYIKESKHIGTLSFAHYCFGTYSVLDGRCNKEFRILIKDIVSFYGKVLKRENTMQKITSRRNDVVLGPIVKQEGGVSNEARKAEIIGIQSFVESEDKSLCKITKVGIVKMSQEDSITKTTSMIENKKLPYQVVNMSKNVMYRQHSLEYEIEKAKLSGDKTKYDMYTEMYLWRCYSKNEIMNRLDEAFNTLMKRREKVAKEKIFYALKGIPMELSSKYVSCILDYHKDSDFINEYIRKKKVEVCQHYLDTNLNAMMLGDDLWNLYFKYRQSYHIIYFDFRKLPCGISERLKKYIKAFFTPQKNYLQKCQKLTIVMQGLVDVFGIEEVEEITSEKISKWLHLKKSNDEKSGNTLRSYVYVIKEFCDYLIKNKMCDEEFANPGLNIHVRNSHLNGKSTPPIPNEVVEQIMPHLDEASDKTRIIFLILLETGMRFGDDIDCRVPDLVIDKDQPDMAILYYYIHKTMNARTERGLNDKRFIHITIGLYDEIKKYIDKTEDIRKKYADDRIFINETPDKLRCDVNSSLVRNEINKIIDKYNIRTYTGEKWHYTNKQVRKSVAVNLISNKKSTMYHVQNLLGHLSPKTTEIYYAEVDKYSLLQKNNVFIRNKFNVYLNDDTLKYYTEDERKVLYMDFLRNYREVEFGYCCKHQSEGSCETLENNFCMHCPKMVTGKKYIEKWEAAYKNSQQRVKEFERVYKKATIPPEMYKTFREYKMEYDLMLYCKATIEAINTIEKRGENNI